MGELERWEGRYAPESYLFGTAPNAFLAAQKSRLPKYGRALSVADGEGRNGVWLAEQGLEVTSMDFSKAAQVKARALAASRGVTITTENVDISAYDWPENVYDVIVVIFAQPLERTRALLRRPARSQARRSSSHRGLPAQTARVRHRRPLRRRAPLHARTLRGRLCRDDQRRDQRVRRGDLRRRRTRAAFPP